jgi:hypothetical protein
MLDERKNLEIRRMGIVETYKKANGDQRGQIDALTREYDKMASAAIEETSELLAKVDDLEQEVQLYQNRQLWDENKALDEMRVAAQ